MIRGARSISKRGHAPPLWPTNLVVFRSNRGDADESPHMGVEVLELGRTNYAGHGVSTVGLRVAVAALGRVGGGGVLCD